MKLHKQPISMSESLPFTFTLYKGNSPEQFCHHLNILSFCTDCSGETYKKMMWYEQKFLNTYRSLQINSKETVNLPMIKPIRVRTGKPVLTTEPDSPEIYLSFSEYTDNLCTFDLYDEKESTFTVVLDESRVPSYLLPGYYNVSMKIITRPEFWKSMEKTNRVLFDYYSDTQIRMEVTLEKYDRPYTKNNEKENVISITKYFPSSLKAVVSEFRETFNC